MDPEYFVVVPADGAPIVGHTSGSDNYRIRFRSTRDCPSSART
jgi:hypothetical protein